MIWFTADHHFFHDNIIKYENRPFDTVSEMNRYMIEQWNEYIDEEDVVYVLGDFSFGKTGITKQLVDKLNGYKYFVIGSHDAGVGSMINRGFDGIFPEMAIIDINGTEVRMQHEPNYYDKGIYLCGHVHGKWKEMTNEMSGININVGVDVRDFRPVSLHQVVKWLCELGLIK